MKPAYTLVELMVALAIGALLVGLAIPRFTAYQQQLEFEQQARIIQECMQGAADQAVAPQGTTDGLSKLTVSLAADAATNTTSCSYVGDNNNPVTRSASATDFLCPVQSLVRNYSSSISYVMPMNLHGAVKTMQLDPGAPGDPVDTTSNGIPPLVLVTQPSDCKLNPIPGITLLIPASGTPISMRIQQL